MQIPRRNRIAAVGCTALFIALWVFFVDYINYMFLISADPIKAGDETGGVICAAFFIALVISICIYLAFAEHD